MKRREFLTASAAALSAAPCSFASSDVDIDSVIRRREEGLASIKTISAFYTAFVMGIDEENGSPSVIELQEGNLFYSKEKGFLVKLRFRRYYGMVWAENESIVWADSNAVNMQERYRKEGAAEWTTKKAQSLPLRDPMSLDLLSQYSSFCPLSAQTAPIGDSYTTRKFNPDQSTVEMEFSKGIGPLRINKLTLDCANASVLFGRTPLGEFQCSYFSIPTAAGHKLAMRYDVRPKFPQGPGNFGVELHHPSSVIQGRIKNIEINGAMREDDLLPKL